jgi:riboflavin kinase/FMN adenylyltransferase
MKRYFTTLQKDEIDSIAIGRFDGLHIGHQKLISNLSDKGALLVVERQKATLTPNKYRCKFCKIDCIFLNFDEVKNMSANEFVIYLKEHFKNLKKIVVGYDFRFGKSASASTQNLKELFDGEVKIIDEVAYFGTSVHSKEIRILLKDGDIDRANRLLNRPYEIFGTVISGQGLGKKEIFATINIEYGDFLTPKNGVYASYINIEKKRYKAATFVGNRLSTDGKFSIETHIIDKDIEVFAGEVSIEFIKFIRENRKFDSLGKLKQQIVKDLTIIKDLDKIAN